MHHVLIYFTLLADCPQLHHMWASMLVDYIHMNSPSSSQVLLQLDQFYSNAFSQLVLLVVCIVGAVGVVVPLLIALYQKHTISHAVKELEERLDQKVADLRKTLSEELAKSALGIVQSEKSNIIGEVKTIGTDAMNKIENAEAQLRRNLAAVEGKMWHGMGVAAASNKRFVDALYAASHSVNCYITCDEEHNLIVVIKNIIVYLDAVSAEEIEKSEKPVVDQIETMLAQLRKFNPNGRYNEEVRDLSRRIDKLKKAR